MAWISSFRFLPINIPFALWPWDVHDEKPAIVRLRSYCQLIKPMRNGLKRKRGCTFSLSGISCDSSGSKAFGYMETCCEAATLRAQISTCTFSYVSFHKRPWQLRLQCKSFEKRKRINSYDTFCFTSVQYYSTHPGMNDRPHPLNNNSQTHNDQVGVTNLLLVSYLTRL